MHPRAGSACPDGFRLVGQKNWTARQSSGLKAVSKSLAARQSSRMMAAQLMPAPPVHGGVPPQSSEGVGPQAVEQEAAIQCSARSEDPRSRTPVQGELHLLPGPGAQ